MRKPIFRAEDVKYSFGDMPLLKGISLELCAGETVIIAGRSGCGKSTFLEICAGLRQPQSGQVFWEGYSVAGFTRQELTAARQRTGFIFQKHALIHNFSIFDNIALPLRYHSTLTERDIRIRVKRFMEELGLFDIDRKFPNELSSGQTKCAALARALIMDPCLLFADEPTAGVDPYTETCITNVIKNVLLEKQPAVIMLCNDIRTIRSMKCPLKILDNGKLIDLSKERTSADDLQPAILTTFREML